MIMADRVDLFLGQIEDLRGNGYTFRQIAKLLSDSFRDEITDVDVRELLGCGKQCRYDRMMLRIDDIESSMGIIASRVADVAELGEIEGRLKEMIERLTGLPEVIQVAHDGSHLSQHIVAIEAHLANIDVWLRKLGKNVAV
jgi:hypothetical protein